MSDLPPNADQNRKIDYEKLRELRVEQRLSFTQIALRLDCAESTVKRACARSGFSLQQLNDTERRLDPTIND